MKKRLLILIGIFIISQFGFSLSCFFPGYRIEENKINYVGMKEKISVKKVDVESFKILDIHFGIDKNNVYYNGEIVKNIDANTFEAVSWFMPKPIEGSPWGIGCQSSYIERFKDKNGEYGLEDIIEMIK